MGFLFLKNHVIIPAILVKDKHSHCATQSAKFAIWEDFLAALAGSYCVNAISILVLFWKNQ